MRIAVRFAFLSIFALAISAGTQSSAKKPRIFITDSQSWEMAGGIGGTSEGFGGASKGGARPQTAEIIKTFAERCPQVIVNNVKDKADYIVLLDHEGGKDAVSRDNKVVVFNKDGDSILSNSTRVLGNAVKDACQAINKDWPARAREKNTETSDMRPVAAEGADPRLAQSSDSSTGAQFAISSTPEGADIEIDGNFVGSTPSTVGIAPGQHQITVKKAGFQSWERKMTVTSGKITVSATLVPQN